MVENFSYCDNDICDEYSDVIINKKIIVINVVYNQFKLYNLQLK